MTDFGSDVYCLDSIRTGRLARGVQLVAQNAYHRLKTEPGELRGGEDEEEYGFDLASKIGSSATSAELAALPAQIRNELTKDPRIAEVDTRYYTEQVGPSVRVVLTITCYTDAGPFELVVGVQDMTVSRLGLRAEAP